LPLDIAAAPAHTASGVRKGTWTSWVICERVLTQPGRCGTPRMAGSLGVYPTRQAHL